MSESGPENLHKRCVVRPSARRTFLVGGSLGEVSYSLCCLVDLSLADQSKCRQSCRLVCFLPRDLPISATVLPLVWRVQPLQLQPTHENKLLLRNGPHPSEKGDWMALMWTRLPFHQALRH